MTHDELLDLVNHWSILDESPNTSALRAVLELHKPREGYFEKGIMCEACGSQDYEMPYPCPTIQAIEKEL